MRCLVVKKFQQKRNILIKVFPQPLLRQRSQEHVLLYNIDLFKEAFC